MKVFRAYLAIIIAGAVFGICPDSWVNHDDFCYYFSTDRMKWISANNVCLSMGGYLAEPKTKVESDYLEEITRLHHTSYWLGGTDIEKEGIWKWAHSNESLSTTFTDWNHGEPNNKDNEDCLHLMIAHSQRWNDSGCRSHYNFICEQKIVQTELAPVVPINFG